MSAQIYFVSGIDTAIGKTFTTGFLAKNWNEQGIRTITQKLIQTGNVDISEDIEQHRAIMGCGLLPEDQQKLAADYILNLVEDGIRTYNFDKRLYETLSWTRIENGQPKCEIGV